MDGPAVTSDSSDDDLEDVPGLGDEAAASLGNRKIPPPRNDLNDEEDDGDGTVVLRYDKADAALIQVDAKKRKKEEEAQKRLYAYVRRQAREEQRLLHMLHLQTLLASIAWANKGCNDTLIQAVMLSALPEELTVTRCKGDSRDQSKKRKQSGVMRVRMLLNWFEDEFKIGQPPPRPFYSSDANGVGSGGVGSGGGGGAGSSSRGGGGGLLTPLSATPRKQQQPNPTTSDTPIVLDDSDSDCGEHLAAAHNGSTGRGNSEHEPVLIDSDSSEDATAAAKSTLLTVQREGKGKGKASAAKSPNRNRTYSVGDDSSGNHQHHHNFREQQDEQDEQHHDSELCEELHRTLLEREGSQRSVACLFVVACRVTGLPARLVWSLQPLPLNGRKRVVSGDRGENGGEKKKRKKKRGDARSRLGKIIKKVRVSGVGDVPADAAEDPDFLKAIALSLQEAHGGGGGPAADAASERNREANLGKAYRDSAVLEGCGIDSTDDDEHSSGESASKSARKLKLEDAHTAQKEQRKQEKKRQNKSEKKERKRRAAGLVAPSPPSAGVSRPASTHTSHTQSIVKYDYWAEVYLDKKWVHASCLNGTMDDAHSVEATATQPLHYIIAVDEATQVRDVTERYAASWLTNTHKLRIDNKWWNSMLQLYEDAHSRINVDQEFAEAEALQEFHLKKMIPTSFAEFKNHMLYAIERHLNKNQVIYPKEAKDVLGTVKSETIYPRANVRTLRSKDAWRKDARTVKPGELPAKILPPQGKAKAAADAAASFVFEDDNGISVGAGAGDFDDDDDDDDSDGATSKGTARIASSNHPCSDNAASGYGTELYGEWQTQRYTPGDVINGKVPKNEFGTVDLFKPSMVPRGGVHLPLKGVGKVAKMLGIDFGQAVVGFEFKAGGARPVFEGVVVAAESADFLSDAWEQEQQAAREKRAAKKELKIFKRWHSLITKALLRQRVVEGTL